jgi:PEP-CTERM motif
MRKFSPVYLPAAAVLFFSNAVARAATLDFTLTGQGQTLTFSLPSSPTTLSTSYAGGFTVANISYVLNGTTAITDFGFDNEDTDFFYGTGAFAEPGSDGINLPGEFFDGDELFTGPGTAPVFKTGTFSENNSLGTEFGLSLPPGEYSMTITAEIAPPAVPEPSSLLLLGTGFAGLFGMSRRRFFSRS